MAMKRFPIDNNKDLFYPFDAEKEGLYPVWVGSNFFPLRGYDSSHTEVGTGGWGPDSLNDSLWIGKDVDSVKIGILKSDSTSFQISSLAFENGRRDFKNIFVSLYEEGEGGSSDYTILDERELSEFTELSDDTIPRFPFNINTSIRIPEGVSTFPGVTLEAPFDLKSYGLDSWTCRVILPKTVDNFTLLGGEASSTNQIAVSHGRGNSDEFFDLNSDKGTVEIYLLDHTSPPNYTRSGNDILFNVKIFVNETVFKQLGFESEEKANSNGVYLAKIKTGSGFSAKVAEALGTSSLDIEVNPLENSQIDDIFNIPSLEVLSYYRKYDEDLGKSVFIGTIKVLSNDQNQVKYIDFTRSSSDDGPGPIISAKYYALVDNVKVGNENVSSYLSVKDSDDKETTFSFRGASVTSGIIDPSPSVVIGL
jgi:hypothetical protein